MLKNHNMSQSLLYENIFSLVCKALLGHKFKDPLSYAGLWWCACSHRLLCQVWPASMAGHTLYGSPAVKCSKHLKFGDLAFFTLDLGY